MEWKQIQCYLCDEKAEELLHSKTRNLRIRCDKCNCFYELSSGVQKFRMINENQLKTASGEVLTKPQKDYLISYIRDNLDPTGREPVLLTIAKYDKLLNKFGHNLGN